MYRNSSSKDVAYVLPSNKGKHVDATMSELIVSAKTIMLEVKASDLWKQHNGDWKAVVSVEDGVAKHVQEASLKLKPDQELILYLKQAIGAEVARFPGWKKKLCAGAIGLATADVVTLV